MCETLVWTVSSNFIANELLNQSLNQLSIEMDSLNWFIEMNQTCLLWFKSETNN